MNATHAPTQHKRRRRPTSSRSSRPLISGDRETVARVWKAVREHPVPTVGALAVGLGTYALITKLTNGKSRHH